MYSAYTKVSDIIVCVLNPAGLGSAVSCSNGPLMPQIPALGVPLSLQVTSMCFAAQFYFVTNFFSTFRDRGCGKNGSTVAVRLHIVLGHSFVGCREDVTIQSLARIFLQYYFISVQVECQKGK